jgi:putative glycosyltransferase (TIGR04372 family)
MLSASEGRPLFISRPQSNQYGHLALEIHLTLAYARDYGADVYFVRDSSAVSHALYEIDSNAVRILRPTAARRLRFGSRLMAEEWRRRRAEWQKQLAISTYQTTRDALADYCVDPDVPAPLQQRLREIRRGLEARRPRADEKEIAESAYVERTRMREPIETFIHAGAASLAREHAARIGVTEGMKLVCVHARESGYKRGRETQDHPLKARHDSTRNARIETYFEAIDRLVARGYTVVRVGDPSMTPVRRPGVIDLATLADRPALAELYCMLHSDFIVCGESGPLSVAYLTNTPIVTVNGTDPIGGYPIRRDGLHILKGVFDRFSGRRLPLRELFEEEFLGNLRNTKRYVFVDNTPAEIAALIDEMHEWIEGRHAETEAQIHYRAMATETSVAVRDRQVYVRKHGPDRGFLGDGRIGRQYVEQYY